jgi:hypothetical protein
MVQQWYNPQDEDGEWNIVQLVAVRGPPERRFWKIQGEAQHGCLLIDDESR